jgi:hypothetical protein
MNKEMSKALTSQTLATEISGNGSRAAAETHLKRTDLNQKTDRMLVADTINQLFAWITEVNFGDKVPPPEFKYVDKKELNTADVKFFTDTTKLIPVRTADIYKRLELSEPTDGEEVIFTGGQNTPEDEPEEPASFAKLTDDWRAEDQAIEDIVLQVKKAVDAGETLEDVLLNIAQLMPDLDATELDNLVRNELEIQYGLGLIEAENGNITL